MTRTAAAGASTPFESKKMIAMAGVALVLSAAAGPCFAQAPPPAARPQQGPTSGIKPPTTPAGFEAAKPNPQAPGFRIPLPPLDQMAPAEREAFESAGRAFYSPVGNRVPLLLAPELNKGWTAMTAAAQTATIPQDVYELGVIMVGAYWGAAFEWLAHAPLAINAGVPAEAVEAIRLGKKPKFANERQQATYDVMQALLQTHDIPDATYEKLRLMLGSKGMVELITVSSWYGVVSMSIVAHGIPIRSDIPNPFPKKK